MGALKRPEYESLDSRALDGVQSGAKTSNGAVEHNRSMAFNSMGTPDAGETTSAAAADGRLPQGQSKVTEPPTTMPNQILTDSDSQGVAAFTGHELDAFLGKAFEEKPIWTGLWESIRDVFFPPKLPPLELTSTPIPVPDRMKVKANPWAVGISLTVNGIIVALILYYGVTKVLPIVKQQMQATNVDVGMYKAPVMKDTAGGGGGGGNHSILEASKGKLPKIEDKPVVPPTPMTFDKPKIPMPSAIEVQKSIQLPDNPNMPMVGMHSSSNVVLSAGTGSSGGMGSGNGGGLGSGNGNGYGPGSGGNAGGGVYRVGGGISAPIPLVEPDAEFSDEARRAKYQGVVLISMIVDAQGNPQNPRVVRPLGMGLDEKALEAVRKYKFKPALKDGRTPVPVMVTVEVNFRLY
jgi:periplasmic protein TonB